MTPTPICCKRTGTVVRVRTPEGDVAHVHRECIEPLRAWGLPLSEVVPDEARARMRARLLTTVRGGAG